MLQDVVSHHKSLKKYRESSGRDGSAHNLGIKALSKQSRERLDAYQHLFYHLQVGENNAKVSSEYCTCSCAV